MCITDSLSMCITDSLYMCITDSLSLCITDSLSMCITDSLSMCITDSLSMCMYLCTIVNDFVHLFHPKPVKNIITIKPSCMYSAYNNNQYVYEKFICYL